MTVMIKKEILSATFKTVYGLKTPWKATNHALGNISVNRIKNCFLSMFLFSNKWTN